jgi:hypothetical protein
LTVPRESAISGNSRRAVDLVTQKSAKKKSKKATKAGTQPGVLGSLRSTRPERIGGDRRAATRARPTTAAKPVATKAAAKPAAAKKAAEKQAAKPKAAKSAKGKVKPTKPVVARPKAAPTRIPEPAGDGRPSGPPRGTEIVTTAVQAAGELAQIGATVGGQLIRRAARRIPRP